MRRLVSQAERAARAAHPNHGSWSGIVASLCLLALLVAPLSTSEAASNRAAPTGGPQLRVVAVSIGEVYLNWTAGGSSVTGYKITRDGRPVASMDANTLTYADAGLQPSTDYVYQVEAVGAAVPGQLLSAAVPIKTPALPETPDNTPPAEPEDLMGSAGPGRVDLEWGESSDDTDVSAYVIRRDGQVLAIVDSATQTYTDTTVQPGRPYAYTVEALDVVGHRSLPAGPFLVTAAPPLQPWAWLPFLASGAAQPAQAGAQIVAAAAVSGYATALRRYPYLTDTVGNNATVNFATDRSGTSASVKYGPVGSCTANTVTASKTNLTVNSVLEYQWKAQLPVTPNTQYCYRVYLATTDLLGTNASPKFWSQLPAGSTQPFTFAVFGDWGSTDSSGANPDQANLMKQLAASGARFAVSTGDNSYPSGSQTNYGDLAQTGANISGVFGRGFWAQAGASLPLFPATGNHGYASTATLHPHFQNFPEDAAVASSGGRYQVETYCCKNGTTSAKYPSAWYAFDAGVARFYVLTAAWADANLGSVTDYRDDHDYHWTSTSAEYQWLKNDLAKHPSQVKFAIFHYPLYSDNTNEPPDTYLQGPNSLEGLLHTYGVTLAFSGHSHNYQRFDAPNASGLPTLLTGGGGARLTPINKSVCASFTVYAIGWSYSANGGAGGGSSCGSAAPAPSTLTARGQVFHFLLVTVNGSTITIKAVNSRGTVFDQASYTAK